MKLQEKEDDEDKEDIGNLFRKSPNKDGDY